MFEVNGDMTQSFPQDNTVTGVMIGSAKVRGPGRSFWISSQAEKRNNKTWLHAGTWELLEGL